MTPRTSTVAAPESSLPLRPSAATDALPSPAKPPGSGEGLTTDEAGVRPSPPASLTTNGAASASSAPAAPFSLATKLAAVAGDIDRVAKKGRNREQNYTFAAAGDIFDEIRGKLAAQRVALRWSIDRENTHLDAVESKGGAKGLFATLWIIYTFIDGDSGEAFDYYTIGTANDYPGDKAVYKAQTNALKYLLTQTFLVSTGDDVENDSKPTEADGATYRRGERPVTAANTAAADKAAVNHLTPEQLDELERLNKTLAIPVGPGLPWNSLVAGRPFESIKAILEARRENGKA